MTPHHIVLVGGGHTNVQVLRAFAEKPEPGAALTLVSKRRKSPYSGMLPGHISGAYARDDMHIDLQRLADVTGTRFILGRAVGVDRAASTVVLSDGRAVAYDTLSLNVGIAPDLSHIEGADRYGIAVKPIGSFLERIDHLVSNASAEAMPRRVLVVGGGPGGIELALALKARMAAQFGQRKELNVGKIPPLELATTNCRAVDGPAVAACRDVVSVEPGKSKSQKPWVGLVTASGLAPSLNPRARRLTAASLARNGITVIERFKVAKVTSDGAKSVDGRFLAADAVILSTAARAPAWLSGLGLPVAADGSLITHQTLASTGDEAIFAVGDCGTVAGDRREKAGVYAVRQGPPLIENLRRRVRSTARKSYRSPRQILTILATGDGRAIAARGSWFAVEGTWAWHWKDWIDREFMSKFNDFRR